jgi:hypothetical protein
LRPDQGSQAAFGRESLSRKRVLNPPKKPEKIIPETPWVESTDVFAMRTMLQTSGERLHIALSVALLAACAANLALVCTWL